MNFAEKLRQARLDAGLSQQQLADKSGSGDENDSELGRRGA